MQDGVMLWLVARQLADTKPIEKFMTIAKSQFTCDRRVIRALRARQNYKLASREQ